MYQLFIDNHLTTKEINIPTAVHGLAVSTDKKNKNKTVYQVLHKA